MSTAATLRLAPLRAVFGARVASPKEWIVIIGVALVFVFMPQLPNNDWQRNAADLPLGLSLYSNPAYVYPPWALLLLFPYYLMTEAGSRVASVLLIGWLAQRRGWSLAQFLSIALAPLFLWTMVLSSSDIFVLVLPIILWDIAGRWQPVLRGVSLAILLLKPQVTLLLITCWLWALRREPRQLLYVLLVAAAITLPISVIGAPPLLAGWFHNLTHPITVNLDHWVYNNLSLTYRYGFPLALTVVIAAFGGLYLWIRQQRRRWTADHTTSAALTASMLVAPYASGQSAIVPIALHPSWRVTLIQYVLVFGTAILNIYAIADEWIVLACVALAMALSARVRAA